jgi:formamidopyrimidine-DNA glycosylase
MPELPEVETIRRGLHPTLLNKTLKSVIVRRDSLRIPFPKNFAKILTGRKIINLTRRSKYLLMHMEGGDVVIIHLGMSGSMKILENNIPKPDKHDHVDFCLVNNIVVRYNDPRRFGLMALTKERKLATHKLLKFIGPDPLSNSFNYMILSESLAQRKIAIKSALLDQKIIGGLGNIYVNESLFRSGILPTRTANSLIGVELDKLVLNIRKVLMEALEAGGSSLSDHIRPDGKLGYFQNNFRVYGKQNEMCTVCLAAEIVKIKQSGRSTFFCPVCQK